MFLWYVMFCIVTFHNWLFIFKYYQFLFSAEHNCRKRIQLIEENWAILDILLFMVLPAVLLVIIVCGVKNCKNENQNQSHHFLVWPSTRRVHPITSDLLPSCPPIPALLTPPYTIWNPTPYRKMPLSPMSVILQYIAVIICARCLYNLIIINQTKLR